MHGCGFPSSFDTWHTVSLNLQKLRDNVHISTDGTVEQFEISQVGDGESYIYILSTRILMDRGAASIVSCGWTLARSALSFNWLK